MDEKDLAILNTILAKYYNDSQESTTLKEQIVSELTTIVNQWITDTANSVAKQKQKKNQEF